MNINNYRTPRKNPLFDSSFKHIAHLLLIVVLIFIGSIITAFGSDEEEITKTETRKIVNTAPIVTEANVENIYFDLPLDQDIQKYIFTMCSECNTCDLDPVIVIAIIWRESKFDTNAIGDNGDSLGLMQVQHRWHSDRMKKVGASDLLDPYQNIRVGIDYLVDLYSMNDDTEWVLMAYNGGPTYANNLRDAGTVSDYALEVLEKAKELREASRI